MGDTSFAAHLEGMALRAPSVEGGSGYVASTVRDQGFADEATKGVVGSGEKEENTQNKERSTRRYFKVGRLRDRAKRRSTTTTASKKECPKSFTN